MGFKLVFRPSTSFPTYPFLLFTFNPNRLIPCRAATDNPVLVAKMPFPCTVLLSSFIEHPHFFLGTIIRLVYAVNVRFTRNIRGTSLTRPAFLGNVPCMFRRRVTRTLVRTTSQIITIIMQVLRVDCFVTV